MTSDDTTFENFGAPLIWCVIAIALGFIAAFWVAQAVAEPTRGKKLAAVALVLAALAWWLPFLKRTIEWAWAP